MGTLFQALCQLEGKDKMARLINFQAHRFLGLVRVPERMLELWALLKSWFSERSKPNKTTTRSLPRAGKKGLLEQLLSPLKPIKEFNAIS